MQDDEGMCGRAIRTPCACADTAGVKTQLALSTPVASEEPVAPEEPVGPEKRREPRFELLLAIHGRAASQRVLLGNISDSGCLVYSRSPLVKGVTYTFQFYVAPHLGQVRVDARVVYARGYTDDRYPTCVAGVEFVGDRPEQRSAIERLIAGAAF